MDNKKKLLSCEQCFSSCAVDLSLYQAPKRDSSYFLISPVSAGPTELGLVDAGGTLQGLPVWMWLFPREWISGVKQGKAELWYCGCLEVG